MAPRIASLEQQVNEQDSRFYRRALRTSLDEAFADWSASDLERLGWTLIDLHSKDKSKQSASRSVWNRCRSSRLASGRMFSEQLQTQDPRGISPGAAERHPTEFTG